MNMDSRQMQNSTGKDAVLGREEVNVKTLTKISVLGVIAFIVMYFEFPLPMFVSFLKLDFSDVPTMLGAFALGPWAGIGIQLVKNLLHGILKSQTAMVGEIANFLTGSLLVFPAAYIYQKKKTLKTAILGMAVGTVTMAVVMSAANYFILVPLYAKIFGIPLDAIIGMGTAVNPRIVDLKTLVVLSVLPFNVLKGIIVSVLTFLLYKKLSPILHK
jgi:riboflavin transporter FmnP